MNLIFLLFSFLLLGSLILKGEQAEEDAQRMADIIEPKISDDDWRKWVKEKLSESYEVVQGDTLWGISRLMFGNSFLWPKLWTINTTTIGNPHVLEPGFILVFDPNTNNPVLMNQIDTPQTGTTPEWEKLGKNSFSLDFPKFVEGDVQVTSGGNLVFDGKSFPLMLNYFIRSEDPTETPLGQISSSNIDQILLDVNQVVGGLYDKVVNAGIVSIARKEQELGENGSNLYKVVATASVSEAGNGKFKATISNVLEPPRRGDYVFYNVPLSVSDIGSVGYSRKNVGKIVDQAGSGFGYFVKNSFVVINLGSRDGVQIGESFDIVGGDNLNLEAPFVYKRGSLKVVNVSTHYSIGFIVQTNQIVERNATVVSSGTMTEPSISAPPISEPQVDPDSPPPLEENPLEEGLEENISPEEEQLLDDPIKDEDLKEEEKQDDEAIPSFDESSAAASEAAPASPPPSEPQKSSSDLGVEEGSGLDPDSLEDLTEEEQELLNGKPK